MRLLIENVELDLDAEDTIDLHQEITHAIQREASREIVRKLQHTPEWKEIGRAVYASVLDQIRRGIVAQWEAADPNIERSPLAKALAERVGELKAEIEL